MSRSGEISSTDSQIRETYPNRDEETFLELDVIAESYWQLVEQNRSAWSLDLDIRPYENGF